MSPVDRIKAEADARRAAALLSPSDLLEAFVSTRIALEYARDERDKWEQRARDAVRNRRQKP